MSDLVTRAQRLAFWKFQHAEQCMGMVSDLCDSIPRYDRFSEIENKADFYSKFSSIYILYARPFRQSDKVKLDVSGIPVGKQDLHKSMLEFRDKIFAHVDIGARAVASDTGEELAKMIIHNTGTQLVTMNSTLIPTPHGLKDIKDLAMDVKKFCEHQLTTMFLNKLGIGDKLPLGLLKVNLSNAELAPLLVPIDD